jgi:hypothetical protein
MHECKKVGVYIRTVSSTLVVSIFFLKKLLLYLLRYFVANDLFTSFFADLSLFYYVQRQ